MKKQYFWRGSFVIFTVAILAIGSYAYANETSPLIQAISVDRNRIETNLNIVEPALDEKVILDTTLYEADIADHYEQSLILKDQIDDTIR